MVARVVARGAVDVHRMLSNQAASILSHLCLCLCVACWCNRSEAAGIVYIVIIASRCGFHTIHTYGTRFIDHE